MILVREPPDEVDEKRFARRGLGQPLQGRRHEKERLLRSSGNSSHQVYFRPIVDPLVGCGDLFDHSQLARL